MTVQTLLGEGDFFTVQPYQKSLHDLEAEAVAFIGALRQHYNPHMLLLLTRPLEPQGTAYEFRSEDVIYAEEQPSLTGPNGVTVERVRLRVRKNSPAMRMEPFRVGRDVLADEDA